VNGNGHRIFVPSTGKATINLLNADVDAECSGGFQVIDYFAASKGKDTAAEFCLPDPFPGDTDSAVYAVYARALGKPGGSSDMMTCADNGIEVYCNTNTVALGRKKGKSTAFDVSQELLTVCADGTVYGLFDDIDEEDTSYFWEYDNNGLKIAQLRFYYIGEESDIVAANKGGSC
jgi:hypothetical protein